MKSKAPEKNKPEIEPVPLQPVVPAPKPEIKPLPEQNPDKLKPEILPDPEPKTRPGESDPKNK